MNPIVESAYVERGLNLAGLERSIRRAFWSAFGLSPEESPPETVVESKAWFALAKAADALLAKHEGAAYPTVARQFYELWCEAQGLRGPEAPPAWKGLGRRDQVAWEAAVRHLVALLDGEPEDGQSLDALEASWKDWARQRLALPVAQEKSKS